MYCARVPVLVENTAYRSPGDGVDDAKMSNTGL